jgi:hypothetical protein
MSLITLTSSLNEADPRPTDPAIIKNNFKEGIEIRKGSEVALVNLTITKQGLFEVPAGEDNQIVFRIGNSQDTTERIASIPAGSYTGDRLAQLIQDAMNASTIIGTYKGGWSCAYDQAGRGGKGQFTINITPNELPDASAPTLTEYAGDMTFTLDEPNAETTIRANLTNGGAISANNQFPPPNIATGNRGIFGNGGNVSLIAKPFLIPSKANWASAFIGTQFQEVDNNVAGATFDIVASTGNPLANGYAFTLTNWSDARADAYLAYPGVFGSGSFWYSLDHTLLPTDQTQVLFSLNAHGPLDGGLQPFPSGGRQIYNGTGISFKYQAGGLNPATDLGFYGLQQTGFVRNQLYKGQTDYPGNPEAVITGDVGGYDMWIQVKSGGNDGDRINFDLAYIQAQANQTFPNPGWRGGSAYYFQNLEYTNFTSRGGNDWTAYDTNNTDHIKLEMEITGNFGIEVYVSHDTGGDGTFVERTKLADSKVAVGQPAKINSKIKENQYPLRPVYAISDGGYYDTNVIEVAGQGIFDATEISNLDAPTPDSENHEAFVGDPSQLNQIVVYKLGVIPPEKIGGGDGQIPQAYASGAQGDMNVLLGMSSFYYFDKDAGGVGANPITSNFDPVISVAEPSLLLELFDFNIKGANGKTGDTSKVIAVIPKEELQTGNRQGVLHYYPNFPVFIDLNIPETKTYYDLNALLRTPDGTIANDLINPTEITLLIREGEETRQRRLMVESADLIASAVANRNATKINQVGVNNPRI